MKVAIVPIDSSPRQGWAEKFQKMHSLGEDSLLIDDALDIENLDLRNDQQK